MTRPQEEMSMEETRQQMALPTIMVVPYKSNDRSSYADILKNDFDLRIAVSTVKEGFVKLGVKTVAAEGNSQELCALPNGKVRMLIPMISSC